MESLTDTRQSWWVRTLQEYNEQHKGTDDHCVPLHYCNSRWRLWRRRRQQLSSQHEQWYWSRPHPVVDSEFIYRWLEFLHRCRCPLAGTSYM